MNPTFASIEKYLRIALMAILDKAENELMKL